MRNSKKILAIALAILMAISMMPFTAFAATTRTVATGADLKTAVAAAEDGDTIQFTANLTLTAAQVGFKVDKDLTFDLNGCTISGPANGSVGKTVDPLNKTEVMFVVGTQADPVNVTFKDSQGGGSWTYTYSGNSGAYFCDVRDYATVTVESGTYTANALNYAGAIFYVRTATAALDIEDGTFNVVDGSKTDNAVYAYNGTTVINGGTFNANTSTDNSVNINSSATVTFNDGEFNAKTSLPSSSTKIAVNGGTYKNYDGSVNTAPGKYTSDDKVIDATTGEVVSADPTTVAKIDNAQYSTLEAAIAAVPSGGTIKLVADVTVASTIEITDGKSFTINTNGNEISSTVRVFNIRHGSVSISGTGTLSTTVANAAVGVYGSTNSSDANYSKFTLQTYATINAPNGYGVMVGANGTSSFGSVVTIYGTINSKWGVYINGNVAVTDSANAAKFTIGTTSTAASISASNANAVIYAAGYANWTITNANLTGGSAIYIKSGNMTIKNGTYTATGAKTDYSFNANGCDATGDAVIIDSCGYPGSVPTVTISGGTITSANGAAVASYAKQDDPLYPTAEFPRVDEVIPGTSTAVFSSDVTALAADGYETVYDAEAGGYVIAEDNHTVAKIGNAKYDTVEAALTAANTGDTIYLVADATLTTTDNAINKNLTIDFGVHTLTAARWPFINNATLTLNGTTGGIASSRGVVDNYGTLIINGGVYSSTTVGTPTFWNNPDGVIIMNGGTINAVNAGIYNENATFTINDGVINSESSSLTQGNKYSYAVRNLPGSTTTMNGGTINAVHGGIAAFGDGGTDITTVVINDGTITTHNSDAGNDAYYAIYVSGNGTSVTVNGGTFSSPRAAAMLDDDDIGLTENAALVITGGTFTSPEGVATVTRGQNDSDPAISGGTFSSDVSEFAIDGYTAVYDETAGGYVIAPVTHNKGVNFLLDDGVTTNIYLDSSYDGDYTVDFTYNLNSDVSKTPNVGTVTKSIDELEVYVDEDSPYNGFTMYPIVQAPAQMSEDIEVTVKNADGGVVDTFVVTPSTVCAQQAAALAGDADSANLKALYEAMLDYGKAAQDYFGYNTGAPILEDGFIGGVEEAEIIAPAKNIGVAVNGVSIVVNSKLGINLYTADTVTAESATLGSKQLSVDSGVGSSTGRNVITVRGIDAADLDTNFTVVTNAGTIEVSAYAVAAAIANANVSANYQNLAKALYLYGEAADAYFA